MLRLSVVFKSKELRSVGYNSMGCDDNNELLFWGPEDEWYVWVPGIDWWGLGLSNNSPLKIMRRLTKR